MERDNFYDMNNDSDDAQEISIDNLITEQLDILDDHIDYLWDTIVLRYIESTDNIVLNTMGRLDKNKFRKFIIEQIKKTHIMSLEEST